jgi:hypothetical protein
MITSEQKLYIANGYNKNYNAKMIGDILGLLPATVRKFKSRQREIATLPPKETMAKSKISSAMALKMKKHILETPKTSNKKILKAVNSSVSPSKRVSRSTLQRALAKNDIVKKKSNLKPILSEVTREKRMNFVKRWLVNGLCQLENVIWSDETTVKSHPNTRRESAYVNVNDSAHFQAKVHSGGISQMFWGSFSRMGTGPLITIDGTMDSELYEKVLQDHLLPEFEVAKSLGGDWKLMQDNAPCHKSKRIMGYLAEQGVEMMEWPPYSPDMNPIENLWGYMKLKLANDYPVCTNKKMLELSFLKIWESITPEMCAKFCGNYGKRLEAVKKANGGITKY